MAEPPTRRSLHLTDLSEVSRDLAHERYQLLRPALEEGVRVTDLAHARGLPLRSVQRWVARYRQKGLVGLVRSPRADRDRHRRLSAEGQRLIEGLALRKPPPTAAFVYRQFAAVAKQEGWPIPSYSLVYRVIRQLDPGLVTLAHDGAKAYREEFDLLYCREANQPNEIWQADHTLANIWLVDERGKPARPWLTALVDDYSRAVPGYFLGFQAPSALHTSLALRQGIWRKEDPRWHVCGIPDVFYTDHGSDFTSRHVEQVSADLKIQLVFSAPGMPRGRGRIERFFETVDQLFLCRLPGYAPKGQPIPTPSLTLPEFDGQFREFLLGEYHQRVNGETNVAPQARWEHGGFLPRLPESLEQLDLLLLTVARARRVHPDGIHFQGQRFLDLTLAAYVGQDVTIRYDPRDLAEIRVFHRDAFLCRAICPELASRTIGLKEIVQARNERRRALRGDLRDRAAIVEQFLAVHRPEPTPPAPGPDPPAKAPRLKRYYNE
jgi:putative transposase